MKNAENQSDANRKWVSRSLISWILLSSTQVLLFIVVHKMGYLIRLTFGGQIKSDLGWGILVEYLLYSFAAISFTTGLLSTCLFRRFSTPLQIVGFLVFILLVSGQFDYRPMRALLLVVSAGIGTFLPFIVLKKTATIFKLP